MLHAKTLHERLRESVGELFFKSSTSVTLRKLPSNDSRNLRKEYQPQDQIKTQPRIPTPNNDAEQEAKMLKLEQVLREKALPPSPLPQLFEHLASMDDYPIPHHEVEAHQAGEHSPDANRGSHLGRLSGMSDRTARGHVFLRLDFDLCKAVADVLKAHRAFQRVRADAETKQHANNKFIDKLKQRIVRTERNLDRMKGFQYMRGIQYQSEAPDYTTEISALKASLSDLTDALVDATDRREETIASIEREAQQCCAAQIDVNAYLERVFIGANLLERADVLPPRRPQAGALNVEYKTLVEQHGIIWDEDEDGAGGAETPWTLSSLGASVDSADVW